MATEMIQNVNYSKLGNFLVSNEIFLDLVFTEKCNFKCKYCIANTKCFAIANFERWKQNLKRTFDIFDIKNIIILGGEATIDPLFFEKLDILKEVIKGKGVDNIILTTNGSMLRSQKFLEKLVKSCVTSINLSYMNYRKDLNDKIMVGNTLTKEEVKNVFETLKQHGMTMRINTNVFLHNNDTIQEMTEFVGFFKGCCDTIKFSPLMPTDMFDTVDEVTEYTNCVSLKTEDIRNLYDDFAKLHSTISKNSGVFGLIPYRELNVSGQNVILKYMQVEDTYDLDTVIPSLKLYPNGNLANEWNFKKNILEKF